jgi:hypothetical protein
LKPPNVIGTLPRDGVNGYQLYQWWETIDAWITATSAAARRVQDARRTKATEVPDAAGALRSDPS